MRTLILVTLLAGAISCAAVPACDDSPILFDKPAIDRAAVANAIAFETRLSARYDVAPPEGEAWFEVLEGTAPVLISAPHATQPTRMGGREHRFSEPGTGALAVALHELTGATVIYTTYKSPSDPNFYDDNAYKETLAKLIAEKKPRLVLDLHGSHWYRSYDVDFGTMEGRSLHGQVSLLRRLSDQLRAAGLTNLSQDRFAASTDATVTKFASTRGVPSIQLEINSTWISILPARDAACESDPVCEDDRLSGLFANRFAQLLDALTKFVRSVASA